MKKWLSWKNESYYTGTGNIFSSGGIFFFLFGLTLVFDSNLWILLTGLKFSSYESSDETSVCPSDVRSTVVLETWSISVLVLRTTYYTTRLLNLLFNLPASFLVSSSFFPFSVSPIWSFVWVSKSKSQRIAYLVFKDPINRQCLYTNITCSFALVNE